MQAAQEAAIDAVQQLRLLLPAGENYQEEWTARVRFNQNELGHSFSVYIFLGPVPSVSEKWHQSDAFVGTVDAFVGGYGGDPEESDMEGFVHLNNIFLKRSGQTSLDPKVVIPYLKENLNWAVQGVDGEMEEMESLEVMVLATPMNMPLGGHIPITGKPVLHPEITHGRKGGAHSLTHAD